MPLLLILFIGSGCAALIYEIVWFQLLQLVLGSSAVSLGVLLGTFMGGMCLGSLLLPRVVPARLHPLRVYGAIELATGAIGLAVLSGMPAVDQLYAAHGGGQGLAGPLAAQPVAAVDAAAARAGAAGCAAGLGAGDGATVAPRLEQPLWSGRPCRAPAPAAVRATTGLPGLLRPSALIHAPPPAEAARR